MSGLRMVTISFPKKELSERAKSTSGIGKSSKLMSAKGSIILKNKTFQYIFPTLLIPNLNGAKNGFIFKK